MIKIQIIGSSQSIEKVREVIERSFHNLEANYYEYNHFMETPNIIQKLPFYADIILFTGLIPYHLGKEFIKNTNCICIYLSHCKSSLLRAMFEAHKKCFRTDIISLDGYQPSELLMVQKEYDPNGKPITVFPVADDIFGLNYDDLLAEHIFNHTNKKATCLTTLYTAHKKMLELNIPSVYIGYSVSKIEDVLHHAILEYSLRIDTPNNFVLLNIKIDAYNEHSIYNGDHHQQALNKLKIATYIYSFAKSLKAAVIESNTGEFWLLATDEVLRSNTQDFKNIELAINISNAAQHTISMGIGYGNNMNEIKNSAMTALNKAILAGGNKVFICKEGFFFTPLDSNRVIVIPNSDNTIDNTIVNMVKTIGISLGQVFKLISIAQNNKKSFTPKELASLTGYNIRTVNRIIEKLAQHNFCKIIGKKSLNTAGRPSRVVEFNFDKFNLYTQ